MGTLDDVLNFLIPIFVVLFLFWILYKIPMVGQMVHWIGGKISDMRERREQAHQGYSTKVQSITYE